MNLKCAIGKFCRTSITTNHINDIHNGFNDIHLFFFFFFLPAYRVPFFLNPVRETYNQVGMALAALR